MATKDDIFGLLEEKGMSRELAEKTYGQPKEVLDLGAALNDEGLKLVDVTDDGEVLVDDGSGTPAPFDYKQMLWDEGIDPITVKPIFNSPSSPIERSPVDIINRTAQGFGNVPGIIQDLSNKFDEVVYDDKNGRISVLKNGAYYAVDPEYLGTGDNWDKARELASEFGENISTIISATLTGVGASSGAALAGTGGTLASGGVLTVPAATKGGIIGAATGGYAASVLNTSLGKVFGTYKNTPEGEILDNALEGALAAVGQGITPAIMAGGKASLGWLKNGLKKIGNLPSGTKDSVIKMLGWSSAAGDDMVARAVNKSGEFTKNTAAIKAAYEAGEDGIDNATENQLKSLMTWARGARSAIDQQFDDGVVAMMDQAEKAGLKLDKKQMFGNFQTEVNKLGFGVLEVLDDGTVALRPFNRQEKIAKELAGESIPDFTPEQFGYLQNKLSGLLNDYMAPETMNLQGKAAAKSLQSIYKRFNDMMRNVPDDPAIQDLVKRVAVAGKNSVNTAFDDVPEIGAKFGAINQTYSEFIDPVNKVEEMLRNSSGFKIKGESVTQKAQTFLNNLLAKPGKQGATKAIAGQVNQLLEQTGHKTALEAFEKVYDIEAAKRLFPIMPRIGLVNVQATAGASAGFLGLAADSPLLRTIGMVAFPAFSPRLARVGAQVAAAPLTAAQSGFDYIKNPAVQYSRQTLGLLKSLSPKAMKELVNNPAMFNAVITTPFLKAQEETVMTDEMNQYIQDSLNKAQ